MLELEGSRVVVTACGREECVRSGKGLEERL